MKFNGAKLLALCVCNVWWANAFVVPAPKAESLALHSYYDADVMERTSAPTDYSLDEPGGLARRSDNFYEPYSPRNGAMTRADNYYGEPSGRHWSESRASRPVQGNSRGTWHNTYGDRAQVSLQTDGRPLDAEFELWEGPDNTPTKVKVYSEDGWLRPFNAMVETPHRGTSNAMSIRNTGPLEYPMRAGVNAVPAAPQRLMNTFTESVQGGSLRTWTIDDSVDSVKISLETDGLPLMTKVELWGTGSHVKQIAQIYNDDGYTRPFSAMVDTPGTYNTIAIRNTGPIEFPMKASVETYRSNSYGSNSYGSNSYYGSPYDSAWAW